MTIIVDDWRTDKTVPTLAAQYDDGTIVGHYATNNSVSTISYNSSSSPDERGVLWQQPYGAIINGVLLGVQFSSLTSDADIVLYNAAGGVKASISLAPDLCTDSSLSFRFLKLPFPVNSLLAGSWYRLTLKPTTTENITINDLDYTDSETRLNTFGFGYETHRTDAGAWTDTTTKAVQITPLVKEIRLGRSWK